MMDYTNLLRMLKTYEDGYGLYLDAAAAIEDLQAQLPKRGEWKETDMGWDGDTAWVCSVCGEPWTLIDGTPKENNMNFCPNCGAKMGGME